MDQFINSTPTVPRKNTRRQFAVVGVILALVVGVGGWVLFAWLRREPSPAAPTDWKSTGRPDAPVVIREYADFQCPSCQAFHQRILPQLVRDYVDTGRVRFDFHHFLIFSGRESLRAAEASECAGELGQFWQYHDQLFASSPPTGVQRFSDAHFKSIAGGVGLNERVFMECLDSSRYNQKVIDAQIQANALHLPGTPSVFIDDVKLSNPFDYAALQTAVLAAEKRHTWWRFLLP
jgi:protein-disulfide isomerase